MSDLIQLLPDSIANQIAAGEVIQRPASVVKELVENAIDAKADEITINITDAGKTLIQVIDNGIGMSETDARMAFERHSTSKLRKIDDLFSLKTMGFRGEALASIASVAQVVLKTRREEDETGTEIRISASQVESQETVSCPKGSNFMVKNLFFNVPARRKFLKSDNTEFRNILEEINRIALTNIDIHFNLFHNKVEVLNLPRVLLKQRIIDIFGRNLNQNLMPINNKTDIAEITGYIGKPEKALKRRGQQYFFVNNRFMKHPYFYRAVIEAYKNIIQPDTYPSFFIYFKVKPESIDVNIHPTKTEIKFEEERFIYQVLNVTVKNALGKFTLAPTLDFDEKKDFDIPVLTSKTNIIPPKISYNPDYNPFEQQKSKPKKQADFFDNKNIDDWEKLFIEENTEKESDLFGEAFLPSNLIVFDKKYAIFSANDKLKVIDLKRALYRVNYENMLNDLRNFKSDSQQVMFSEEIELSPSDYILLNEMFDYLFNLGFDFKEVRANTVQVVSVPGELNNININELISELIENYKHIENKVQDEIKSFIAKSLAKNSIKNKTFDVDTARYTIEQLFKTKDFNYSPDGKVIIKFIDKNIISNLF